MGFFDRLTDPGLETIAFLAIRNKYERHYAARILLTTSPYTQSIVCTIFGEHTSKRYLYITKTDRLGLQLELTLQKPSGFVRLVIHKKRSAHISVNFLTPYLDKADAKTYSFKHDCNLSWVKSILHEFDQFIVHYVRHGCSNTLRSLNKLIKYCFLHETIVLSVHIDIPGYICLINGV